LLQGGRQIGVIAQEVEKVFPELVTTSDRGYKMVDYSKFTPVIIEAMKEQQKQIDRQQKLIESAKQENQQLKSELQSLKEKMEQIEAMLVKGGEE
jgi:septal ring factor EnvC (AmiA/AmiB activator)